MRAENQASSPPKARIWSIPTVLSLILGVLGAVGIIELRPQMAVSPQEPIEKSQPFSVPFRVENTGYFSFHVVHLFVYADQVKVAGRTLSHSTFHMTDWNNFDLNRSESKTVIAQFVSSPSLPGLADIAVVVDVRPFDWFPHSFRRYFRFTGAYVDNWQWLAQPSGPIQANADKEIEEHMKQIPASR